jgi:pyruvate dehydrogenase (quinone)
MLRNVETGRFDRSLSALTAAGALVTAAEIYFEHDSADFARSLCLHGITVDEPGQVGPAWDQALAAGRPTVLDVRTDPDIPPIPPHATFEQAKDAAMALLKGDPDRWGVLKEGLLTKAREILPNRSE